MSRASFSRLIRFVPKNDQTVTLIGEPTSKSTDIGLSLRQNKPILAYVFDGFSVLSPGQQTSKEVEVGRVLSPVAQHEVGTIRCIGLNYRQHAHEVKLPIPKVPTLFMKPATSLNDPFPATVELPKLSQIDDCADYEAELAVIIGRDCKDVTETEAAEYILGYTACNDVSSRTSQFKDSQWCFSKGFDGACPLGPVLVSSDLIPDPSQLHIKGIKNGKLVQDCSIGDLIFSIPKLISFLSQNTTLLAGTVIITGTPAGVGLSRNPPEALRSGDEFAVEILPHIGTLINQFENA
ncbi:hypothetical protein CC79DRAFT_1335173 [Sarocladium strictum]